MKRLVISMMIGLIGIGSIVACGGRESLVTEEAYIGESVEDKIQEVRIFPTTDIGFVGDTMPFFDEGKMNVFYLADMRDNKRGYHPWALLQTSDYCEYEEKGIVIPYAETEKEQDIALGTGSVIKDKNGKYHAFYTGHNDTYAPKEAIMHAVSDDLENWEKKPEDTFYADEEYSNDDFRDPYVLYVEEENQYWMLVTTRTQDGGVIAKYTSTDLISWKNDGVFFKNDMGTGGNMECPSLIEFDGKWYLGFSDQWPDRVFHYRVSDKPDGKFEAFEQDVIDGNGFYAGRLESDGEKLYAIGWNATKNGHFDSEEYGWGGNMVVHELLKKEDGSLVPVVNSKVQEKMATEVAFNGSKLYSFSGKDYEVVEFNKLAGSNLIKGTIRNFENAEKFGFAFNISDEDVGELNLVFDKANNRIGFYNTSEIYSCDPQSEIKFDFDGCKEINYTLVESGGVVSLYVNDQCALTARMYHATGTAWGLFAINSSVQFENTTIYK